MYNKFNKREKFFLKNLSDKAKLAAEKQGKADINTSHFGMDLL